jgi:hypothetical protein
MRLGHNRTFFDKALEVVHLSKGATRYTECIYIPTALHSIFRVRYLHEVLTWNLFTAMSIHSFNGLAQMVSKSADRWILRRAPEKCPLPSTKTFRIHFNSITLPSEIMTATEKYRFCGWSVYVCYDGQSITNSKIRRRPLFRILAVIRPVMNVLNT